MPQSQHTHPVRVLAVLERARELLDHRAPWHRALWCVGTILELREILEYTQRSESGPRSGYGINETAVKNLMTYAYKRVEEDVGIGDVDFRGRVCSLLKRGKLSSEDWYRLQYLVDQAEVGYLERWAKAASDEVVSEERIARHLVEMLLDKGISPDKVHIWLTRRRARLLVSSGGNGVESDPVGVGELVAEAGKDLISENEIDYRVGIPFREYSLEVPVLPKGADKFGIDEGREWLDRNCVGWDPKSTNVAAWNSFLVIYVRCRDQWAAVEKAGELIARTRARISLAPKTRSRYEPIPRAWVAGEAKSFNLYETRREVRVPFLGQKGVLGDIENDSVSSPIADALVLLASMKSSTAGASLSVAWAAMEGLLGGETGGKYETADRMARILAASLPRAELTSLVHAQGIPGKLKHQLAGAVSISQQIGILEQRIREGYKYLNFENVTDQLAVMRIEQIIEEPYSTLERVQARLVGTFNRLNRQRNIVMHDGRLDSIATSASLRIAPALVAAGLDRILAANSPRNAGGSKAPMQLAALALERLRDLQETSCPKLARLLD